MYTYVMCSCEWSVLLSCVLLSCACACDLLIFWHVNSPVSVVDVNVQVQDARMLLEQVQNREHNVCTENETKSKVDALGGITISCGCFERCCSNKKTPPYHSNLRFETLRNRRPTLLRASAYRTPSEASPQRRCGHASRFLWTSPLRATPG